MKFVQTCLVVCFTSVQVALIAQELASDVTMPNTRPAAEMKQRRSELPAEITAQMKKFPAESRAIIEKFMKAEPFPNQEQLLLGVWHGVSVEDPMYKSYWTYERHADGTMRQIGIDLNQDDREYSNLSFDVVWMSKGRVIFEQKVPESDGVDVYLLESLDDKSIKYQIVFDDEPAGAWSHETDKRGPGELPKPPVGWKQVPQ